MDGRGERTENLARLDRYREIASRLAHADGLTPGDARALADEGKAVVWIDGGLHANEVLGAQQLIELVYQLASASDDETLRILRDVIVLAVHANPDGHELVANWYMRAADPRRRSLAGVPRAYQKYVGHDNNRDFYLSSQAETRNINRVLYRDWFPQIVYNHHQSGPPGTVMFAPPFRDPFNYVFDPLIPSSIDLVGAAMQTRFAAEGKPGVTNRGGSTYSAWWNGGLRTTAYFHNQIGLLTETIGDPTPTAVRFVPERLLPSSDLPFPIAPQAWHFRQSIDYSLTANRAVLDFASRYRETVLFNVYQMGRNAIDRGSRDSWTASPRRVDAAKADAGSAASPSRHVRARVPRSPAARPRRYILPSDQLISSLRPSSWARFSIPASPCRRATADFAVQGRRYPAGSFVVKTAQAFRPHVLDMFRAARAPERRRVSGRPAGAAVRQRRLDAGVPDGGEIRPRARRLRRPVRTGDDRCAPGGRGARRRGHRGLSGEPSPERCVRGGQPPAARRRGGVLAGRSQRRWGTGRHGRDGGARHTWSGRPHQPAAARLLPEEVETAGPALRLRPVRVALWDRYGGSSSSGWIRWLLERYEFPFELVYPQTLDAPGLSSRFDVLILPSEAVPALDGPRADGPASCRRRARGISRRAGHHGAAPVPRLAVRRSGARCHPDRRRGAHRRASRHRRLDALVETEADGRQVPLLATSTTCRVRCCVAGGQHRAARLRARPTWTCSSTPARCSGSSPARPRAV